MSNAIVCMMPDGEVLCCIIPKKAGPKTAIAISVTAQITAATPTIYQGSKSFSVTFSLEAIMFKSNSNLQIDLIKQSLAGQ